MQAKLLRLVQQGEVEKVGAGPPRRVDVRIIAATNRDLRRMAETGAFREDLYYRLAVLPLQLPPLRQRPEDIPILAEHLFSKLKIKHGRHDLALPASVSRLLTNGYKWPGNVRELENVLERAVLLARGGFVQASDLPDHLQVHPTAVNGVQVSFPPQGISLEAVEKELIRRALECSGDNQSQAARLLSITRKTLIWKMGKYGLAQGFSQGVRTAPIATTGQAGFSKISGNTSNL